MKKLLLSLVTFLSIAVFAQDSKLISDPNATVRNLNSSFTGITVSSGIELYLTQGNEESIAVSANDQKFMERFKTEVENGVLKIWYDTKGITWKNGEHRKLKAYVSFKTLNKLHGSAGSETVLKGSINAENLDMKFTSGSEFEGQVNAKQITVQQNSGSVMKITGRADKISVDASSGAEFKGLEFAVDFCDAEASSGGTVKISISKELNAKASSGGTIRYNGRALIRDISISSGGTVKKA
jgi:Putative auto-transporter adhesin, head GIN domain